MTKKSRPDINDIDLVFLQLFLNGRYTQIISHSQVLNRPAIH